MKFRIFESFSLKDKRGVIKSIIDKTKRAFNVSIAEIDDNNLLNFTVFGFTCVSNNRVFIESTFDKILNFYDTGFNIEITSVRREFL